MPEEQDVPEYDKPFYLAVVMVFSWVASTAYAAFVLKDIEMAKFLSGVFGPAAGMGLAYYLGSRE